MAVRMTEIQKTNNASSLARTWSNRNAFALLVGMQNSIATWEDNLAVCCLLVIVVYTTKQL